MVQLFFQQSPQKSSKEHSDIKQDHLSGSFFQQDIPHKTAGRFAKHTAHSSALRYHWITV